jgi:hypothetical protein
VEQKIYDNIIYIWYYCNNLQSFNNRVIASASPEDDCWLYQLANFKKSGQLIEAFNTGGSKEVKKNSTAKR